MAKYLGDADDISTFGNILPDDVNLVSTFGWIGGDVQSSIVIPNHVERALSLLIEEFKRSTRLNDMVQVMVEQSQEIENIGNDLLTARRLDQAGGAQLDGIGEIVGEDRQGKTDEEYRAAIKFRIFINTSNAEAETLIRALKFITNASRVRYWEITEATVQMYTNGSFIPNNNIAIFMESVAAGGVNIEYISSSLDTIPFVFALDDFSDNLEGMGWNELGYAPGGIEVGGRWVEGHFG